MGKTTKTSQRHPETLDPPGDMEMLPGRLKGATITPWHGPPEVDLTALFAKPAAGATVSGSKSVQSTDPFNAEAKTVSLSDGTQIMFATAAPGAAP